MKQSRVRRLRAVRARRASSSSGAWLAMTGCASGESILNAGNDAPPPDASTAAADAPLRGPAATTIAHRSIPLAHHGPAGRRPRSRSSRRRSRCRPRRRAASPAAGSARPAPSSRRAPADYAPCPVDALDDADDRSTSRSGTRCRRRLRGRRSTALTDAYNASQDRVVVELQNQNGYNELIDKYLAVEPGRPARPDPDARVHDPADGRRQRGRSRSARASRPRATTSRRSCPGRCSPTRPVACSGRCRSTSSDPVLYYNRTMFEEAGLDPDDPPVSLDELRAAAEQIVDSGVAAVRARARPRRQLGRRVVPRAVAGPGRPAVRQQPERPPGPGDRRCCSTRPRRSTCCSYVQRHGDRRARHRRRRQPAGVRRAAQAGRPRGAGGDGHRHVGRPRHRAAASSAAARSPAMTADDIGVGPMPGPGDTPAAVVGGASLYISRDKGDAEAAAAWDFIKFLVSAEMQSQWAAATGYVPVRGRRHRDRAAAPRTYADDPRFSVAFDAAHRGGRRLQRRRAGARPDASRCAR